MINAQKCDRSLGQHLARLADLPRNVIVHGGQKAEKVSGLWPLETSSHRRSCVSECAASLRSDASSHVEALDVGFLICSAPPFY